MKKRVAVEQTLKNVGTFLQQKGYEIASLDPLSESKAELHNVSAVIISGQDENMMGMQDMVTQSVVIDARGMTEEQVYERLQDLEQKQQQKQNQNQNQTYQTQTQTQNLTAAQTQTSNPISQKTGKQEQEEYMGLTKTKV